MNQKRHIIASVLFCFCVLFIWGCKPAEVTLKGKVFIVTKGAGNIKLGDVDVFLIEKKDVEDFIQKKQAAAKSEHDSLKHNLDSANKEVDTAKWLFVNYLKYQFFKTNSDYVATTKQRDQEQQTLTTLQARHESIRAQNSQLRSAARATLTKRTPEFIYLDFKANSTIETEWRDVRIPEVQPPSYEPAELQAWKAFLKSIQPEAAALIEKIIRSQRLLDDLNSQLVGIQKRAEAREQQKVSDAESLQRFAKEELDEFPTVFRKRFFTGFPERFVREEHTDADGKFSFSFPPKKSFVIFAKAQRMVIDETETYYWLVNTPTDLKSSFILSNSKLTEVDPDGYLRKINFY